MSVVANVAINVDGKNAAKVLDEIKRKVDEMNGSFKKVPDAGKDANRLGDLLGGLASKLALAATAAEVLRKSLAVAFERNAGEQKLRNLTDSTGEFEAAMGLAKQASNQFGLSQTETTKALGDVYGRLKGVGFGLKETGEIYTGFNVIAKQSGLAGEEAAGAFFQLSQALGKGKLNGDEFVTISERMPNLLDAIAKATGKSRGELSGMAQQGKLTSEVLYKALSEAAKGADGLNNSLNKQQQVMGQVTQVTDRLFNAIGQVIGPIVVKGMEFLVWVGNEISDWWGYLGGVIFPKVYKAIQPVIVELQKVWNGIPWDSVITAVQSVAIALMNGWVKAMEFLSPILAAVIKGFVALSNNPVFKFIAEQVQRLAGFLGLSTDKVSEFKAGQDKATEAAVGTLDKYSKMPTAIEDAKAKVQELAAAQERVVSAVKAASEAIERQSESQGLIGAVVAARIGSEQKLNDLQKIGLEQAYETADTADKRYKIAIALFKNEVNAAALQYQAAKAAILIDNEKIKLQQQAAVLKGYEIQAEGKLQILKAGSVEEENRKRQALGEALAAQNNVIRAVAEQGAAQRIVNGYQLASAETQYKTQVATAGIALQQKLVSDEIGLSGNRANTLTGNMVNAATSTGTMAAISGNLATKMGDASAQIKEGTDAAVQNVQVFGTAAATSASSHDRWRETVLKGVGAQQQVATAVQQTTGTVVASNNIRATSSIDADRRRVTSAVNADRQIQESSGFSTKRLTDNWTGFTKWFYGSVTDPISNAWKSLVGFLPKAMSTAAATIKSTFTNVGTTIKSILNGVLRGIINGVNRVINEINWLVGRANAISAAVSGPRLPILPRFNIPQFAEGGVVNKPTLAIVGEGGEREFIIPESKMAAASANYLNGARGGDVIPSSAGGNAQINITTGPVLQQGGQQYVTMADLERAMRKTADGVYASLRTPSSRIALGAR